MTSTMQDLEPSSCYNNNNTNRYFTIERLLLRRAQLHQTVIFVEFIICKIFPNKVCRVPSYTPFETSLQTMNVFEVKLYYSRVW